MVNDEKARMATEGRGSTEDLVEHYPMVSVTVQTEQAEPTEQTEQTEQPPHVRYTIRLQNAYDRPLGGSFTLQVNGQDVQVPAQASASELAALL